MHPGASRVGGVALWAALIGAFTVAWFVAHGYVVGKFDHSIHLVFLERVLDPGALSGDFLAESADAHQSWFWQIQAVFLTFMELETLYLVIHTASLVMMFAGSIWLALSLFPDDDQVLVALVVAILSIIGAHTAAWIPSMDNLVLNRTVVLGAELMAVALAVSKRPFLAFGLAGLAANIHVTTAAHTAIIIFFVALFQKERWRACVVGSVVFFVAALPVVILFVTSAPKASHYDHGWWQAVNYHFPLHHRIFWLGYRSYLEILMPVLLIVPLCRRRFHEVCIVHIGILATTMVAGFLIEVFHSRLAVQLHLLEITRFLAYTFFAAVAVLTSRAWHAGGRLRWLGVALAVAAGARGALAGSWNAPTVPLVISDAAICALGLFIGFRLPVPAQEPPKGGIPSVRCGVAFVLIAFAVALPTKFLHMSQFLPTVEATILRDSSLLEYRQFEHSPEHRDLVGLSVTKWVRNSTPEDALFMTPPYFIHGLTGFRYMADRAVLINFKDGGEATFDPDVADRWHRRLSDITNSDTRSAPIEPGLAGLKERILRAHDGYEDLSERDLHQIAQEYGVTHALFPIYAPAARASFPTVYQDTAFVVLELPGRDTRADTKPDSPSSPLDEVGQP